MTKSADELLAEPIRRSLWNMGWESLRPLQQAAINAILGTPQDIILAARTAAGKTEAAFLPILSQICEAPRGSVRALYVGPLKALINDQFRRLDELCEFAEIPVHRWHGDVSSDKKRQLLERPGGVLLITPESLESLFVNKSQALARLFHSLTFVVIDELHSLLGNERGTQLRSLLFRLERHSVEKSRLIALSATIGDLGAAAHWMRPDLPESVAILKDDGDQKSTQYRIHAYERVPANSSEDTGDGEEHVPPDNFFEDVYENFRGTKNLIFANSKAFVEQLTDRLNELGRRRATGEEFLIHHGSLARDVREDTERLMQGNRPYTTVCSSTLELGIDIGNVRTVGQVGPTWSVSSLVQRLGRSGRRDGEAHQMRVFILEDYHDAHTELDDRLYPDLLQAIAVTELMLERWIDSPNVQPLDFSTLVQQTLSSIAERGGATASELHDQLVVRGTFRFLNSSQFATFLRGLAQHDLIEQRPEGPLILGLVGERLVQHYDFYAAFAAAPEYRVVYGSRLIGQLSAQAVPRPGDHLLLAARRWQVVDVDPQREEISVQPAAGRRPPMFPTTGGDIDPRIRHKMREVLLSDAFPVYVDARSKELLLLAREACKQSGLFQSELVTSGLHSLMWFPWTGTRAMRTLSLIFESAGLTAELKRSGLAFAFRDGILELRSALAELTRAHPSPEQLLENVVSCERRKWDCFVDLELLKNAFIQESLDLPRAFEALERLARIVPQT